MEDSLNYAAKTCPHCQQSFQPRRSWAIHCSPMCAYEARKARLRLRYEQDLVYREKIKARSLAYAHWARDAK